MTYDDLDPWGRAISMLVMQAQPNTEEETFFYEWWEDIKYYLLRAS